MDAGHRGVQGDNADFIWDDFDPTAYFADNYRSLRHDDRQILEAMRDFFAKFARPGGTIRRTDGTIRGTDEAPARGLDLGSGSNLYAALAMLPFCTELTLWEFSRRNVEWLRHETQGYRESWDEFWESLALAPPYQAIADPRAALAERARVHQGSVFELPSAAWDLGTMLFVAESFTTSPAEFTAATLRFVGALRSGAPFAAAFMEGSSGYDVADRRFPAVPVTVESVRACLNGVSRDLDVHSIDSGNTPLRDGYSGRMILALGTACAAEPDAGRPQR